MPVVLSISDFDKIPTVAPPPILSAKDFENIPTAEPQVLSVADFENIPAADEARPAFINRMVEAFSPPPQGLPGIMGMDIPPTEEAIAAQNQPLYNPAINERPTTIRGGLLESL